VVATTDYQEAVTYHFAGAHAVDATVHLFVWFRDGAGNVSAAATTSVTLGLGVRMWDASLQYSITENPSGAWQYGRKWSPEATQFDLMTVQWGDSGWFLGNWGHGGPSIQWGPNMWAKDNSNGLPCVRWTAPEAATYHADGRFMGYDSRGVSVLVFVVRGDSVLMTDSISQNEEVKPFSTGPLELAAGEHLDFLIQFNGGISAETSWVELDAIIEKE
jgi:hypothetical protein